MQQARVAVEAVAAPCVGQEREESLAAQIVDPGEGVSGLVMTYSRAASSK